MLTLNDAYMEHIQQVLESARALPIETRGVDNHKGLLSTVAVCLWEVIGASCISVDWVCLMITHVLSV